MTTPRSAHANFHDLHAILDYLAEVHDTPIDEAALDAAIRRLSRKNGANTADTFRTLAAESGLAIAVVRRPLAEVVADADPSYPWVALRVGPDGRYHGSAVLERSRGGAMVVVPGVAQRPARWSMSSLRGLARRPGRQRGGRLDPGRTGRAALPPAHAGGTPRLTPVQASARAARPRAPDAHGRRRLLGGHRPALARGAGRRAVARQHHRVRLGAAAAGRPHAVRVRRARLLHGDERAARRRRRDRPAQHLCARRDRRRRTACCACAPTPSTTTTARNW